MVEIYEGECGDGDEEEGCSQLSRLLLSKTHPDLPPGKTLEAKA